MLWHWDTKKDLKTSFLINESYSYLNSELESVLIRPKLVYYGVLRFLTLQAHCSRDFDTMIS